MFEGKVFICNINPGQVTSLFMESVIALLSHDSKHWQRVHSFQMLTWGPSLGVGRSSPPTLHSHRPPARHTRIARSLSPNPA